jgi:cytochrome c oxidase subunit 2
MDAVPGYVNKTWFQIPEDAIPEGESQVVFTGQCAELCGRNHANMYGRVIGMRMADYRRWYSDKVAQVAESKKGAQEQQDALEQDQGESLGSSEDQG